MGIIKNFKRFINEHIAFVLAIFAYTFYMWLYLTFTISLVAGSSMYPNYQTGDFLINSPDTSNLMAGDFVSVDGAKVNQNNDSRLNYSSMAKRVIGVPGDTIVIYDGDLYINGEKQEEDYIFEKMDDNEYHFFPLGDEEFFVMGDNRNVSLDSREFGPVKRSWITEKKIFRIDNFDKRSEEVKEEELKREHEHEKEMAKNE